MSFDVAHEGVRLGDHGAVAVGRGLAAITYFWLDRVVEGRGRRGSDRPSGEPVGRALALGALHNGIPEQIVLGIGLAAGEGVRVGLLVAIFVSNVPEAIGSSTAMRAEERRGRRPPSAVVVAAITTVGYGIGWVNADNVSENLTAQGRRPRTYVALFLGPRPL